MIKTNSGDIKVWKKNTIQMQEMENFLLDFVSMNIS